MEMKSKFSLEPMQNAKRLPPGYEQLTFDYIQLHLPAFDALFSGVLLQFGQQMSLYGTFLPIRFETGRGG